MDDKAGYALGRGHLVIDNSTTACPSQSDPTRLSSPAPPSHPYMVNSGSRNCGSQKNKMIMAVMPEQGDVMVGLHFSHTQRFGKRAAVKWGVVFLTVRHHCIITITLMSN